MQTSFPHGMGLSQTRTVWKEGKNLSLESELESLLSYCHDQRLLPLHLPTNTKSQDSWLKKRVRVFPGVCSSVVTIRHTQQIAQSADAIYSLFPFSFSLWTDEQSHGPCGYLTFQDRSNLQSFHLNYIWIWIQICIILHVIELFLLPLYILFCILFFWANWWKSISPFLNEKRQ